MKSSNLAINNLKFIERSNMLVIIGVTSFLVNVLFSSFYIMALIWGVLVGTFLGMCLPWFWRKNISVSGMLVIFIVLTASIHLNKSIDLHASFQMLSTFIFTSGCIWYLQRNKLISYLKG